MPEAGKSIRIVVEETNNINIIKIIIYYKNEGSLNKTEFPSFLPLGFRKANIKHTYYSMFNEKTQRSC